METTVFADELLISALGDGIELILAIVARVFSVGVQLVLVAVRLLEMLRDLREIVVVLTVVEGVTRSHVRLSNFNLIH